MTDKNIKNILYIVFIATVIVLAVIYFSVPERPEFFKNQLKWWGEFREVFLGFYN